jgi:hypothetical protein
LATLNDVGNSLFIPNLGARFFDRTRTIIRPRALRRIPTPDRPRPVAPRPADSPDDSTLVDSPIVDTSKEKGVAPPKPIIEERQYLVLPKGLVSNWDEWTDDEKAELGVTSPGPPSKAVSGTSITQTTMFATSCTRKSGERGEASEASDDMSAPRSAHSSRSMRRCLLSGVHALPSLLRDDLADARTGAAWFFFLLRMLSLVMRRL